MVVPAGILRHSHKVHSTMWSKRAINNRGIGYANLGQDLAAAMRVTCRFAISQNRDPPQQRLSISIKSIDTVVLGDCINNVMVLNADLDGIQVQRLPVHLPVDLEEPQLAECAGVHIIRSKSGLVAVPPSAGNIKVIGYDIC